MKRGAWHQCGDKSQRIAEEQLELGAGVGVIISPRDLSRDNAVEYSERYRALGGQVIIDQQFHNPDYTNQLLSTYPISQFRSDISQFVSCRMTN